MEISCYSFWIIHYYHATQWGTLAAVSGHLIPEGLSSDGILSCQWNAAQQDEEEDEVGEPGGIDNSVTQYTDSEEDRGRGIEAGWLISYLSKTR